ncbi:MAG: hypothetical protein NWR72_04325, partial [Bacteroidia bacterium]|nr:hypothetical protein [Bacteroidia bacterium]
MIHKHWFAVLTLGMLVVTTGCHRGAKDSQSSGKKLPAGSSVWVAFYNVENLFDTDDDPGKDDSEFLPGSELDWTPEKYLEKLDNLTLAITAMNNGKGPDILGLAEVENAQTLSDWTKMTSLKSRNYEYVLEEGPDPRGIDVALMYDPALFAYQGHEVFAVDFPGEPDYITRPILRVDGTISGEEVSVVVVHWPSRRDGEKESEPRRIAAARAVNVAIKDRLADHPDSDIMIMGD